jgi:hypothetical protein
MYLSPDLSKGVEDICASLGIDLNAAVEPLTQQVVQSDFFSSLGYSAEDLKEEDEEDLEELPLPPKKRGKNSDKIDKK